MHRLFVVLLVFLAISSCAWSSGPALEVDAEFRGDPPYLTSEGWIPLLNGRDLSGWHPQEVMDSGKHANEWFTTKAVLFDVVNAPKALSGRPEPGDRIVNGPKGRTANLVTDLKHGDIELYVEFMVAKDSNSGIYLQGLYEIQVRDSYGKEKPSTADCGAIYHRWINEKPVNGAAPRVNACRPAGMWQSFYARFRAPRFDASGKKIANAKFEKVLLNGVLVQENVEVPGGTRSHMPIPEAPLNPLMLQGDHGPVAYRNIYYRPLP
jgi:hypothetical protein